MTILAVSGPIGSDFKGFSEKCYSLLDQNNAVLINSAEHKSLDFVRHYSGDVIIFGPEIFVENEIEADIKVFLDLDPSLCLANYLTLHLNESNFEELINHYFNQIKPLNQKIRLTAKSATYIRTSDARANDKLIELLVNHEDKSLFKPRIQSPRNTFFCPPKEQTDSIEKNLNNIIC